MEKGDHWQHWATWVILNATHASVVAMVIRDKMRQVSRGFGFVTYENPIDAEEAVKHMDAKVRLRLRGSWIFTSFEFDSDAPEYETSEAGGTALLSQMRKWWWLHELENWAETGDWTANACTCGIDRQRNEGCFYLNKLMTPCTREPSRNRRCNSKCL